LGLAKREKNGQPLEYPIELQAGKPIEKIRIVPLADEKRGRLFVPTQRGEMPLDEGENPQAIEGGRRSR
jgi:hypothetical protein